MSADKRSRIRPACCLFDYSLPPSVPYSRLPVPGKVSGQGGVPGVGRWVGRPFVDLKAAQGAWHNEGRVLFRIIAGLGAGLIASPILHIVCLKLLKRKKGRCRPCRKMFLEPDVPPSRIHMSIVQDVIKQHDYVLPALSKAMCFPIATPSLSISARNARRLSLDGEKDLPIV